MPKTTPTPRSKAYPAIPLDEALTLTSTLLDALGSHPATRADIASELGYESSEGGVAGRKIAALVHYGLLERRRGRYTPTPLAEQAINPRSDAERDTARREALRSPQLFHTLLEHYDRGEDGAVSLPAQLEAILSRDHGITRRASGQAADVFRRSARFAGLLDTPTRPAELGKAAIVGSPTKPTTERGDGGGEQRIDLALAGGRLARLSVPLDLDARDVDLLRRLLLKQLEMLELQAEIRE